MKDIVGQLADLTALRDRQSLDAALISTLHDLLHPERALIARLVGQRGDERWLTSAEIHDGALQSTASQAWADLDELPLAQAFAQRQQVLDSQRPVLGAIAGDTCVFPLMGSDGPTAVLELHCTDVLSGEQVRLVSAVLRLYQNFQNLLDYGERDALTELLNRKTFDGTFLKATTPQPVLPEPIANDRRHPDATPDTPSVASASYWLAMLDIDHFKRVNDTYGHLIGDEVLLLLARIMRNTFRFYDQLYRFGGEEFVVLMRCQHAHQAQAALQRLRCNIENYRFPQVGQITVSVGFSEVRFGDSPSSAIERADKAVYYAKEHGRNQVCSHEDLVAQGKLAAEPGNQGDIELF